MPLHEFAMEDCFVLFVQPLLIKYCVSSARQALKKRKTTVDPVNNKIHAGCGGGGRGPLLTGGGAH